MEAVIAVILLAISKSHDRDRNRFRSIVGKIVRITENENNLQDLNASGNIPEPGTNTGNESMIEGYEIWIEVAIFLIKKRMSRLWEVGDPNLKGRRVNRLLLFLSLNLLFVVGDAHTYVHLCRWELPMVGNLCKASGTLAYPGYGTLLHDDTCYIMTGMTWTHSKTRK